MLSEVFAPEVTAARGRCDGVRERRALGEAARTWTRPGSCALPGCDAVLLVLVRGDGHAG